MAISYAAFDVSTMQMGLLMLTAGVGTLDYSVSVELPLELVRGPGCDGWGCSFCGWVTACWSCRVFGWFWVFWGCEESKCYTSLRWFYRDL